jgi:hypothetical protein
MTPNYIKSGIKTKQEAFVHIFGCFSENPGVADKDGKLRVMFGKEFITVTPKKKKKEVRYET